MNLKKVPVNRGMLSNAEKYFILNMQDTYKKCKLDGTWLARLDEFNEDLIQAKIAQSHILSKRDELAKNLESFPFAVNDESRNYFQKRMSEINYRVSSINQRIKNTKYKLYGFIYFPLLICVEQFMNFHNGHHCDQHFCAVKCNSSSKWDLSKLLLTIIQCGYFKIYEFDRSDFWNPTNIFAHPIIALCDDGVDDVMRFPKCLSMRNHMIEHSVMWTFKRINIEYLQQIFLEIMQIYFSKPNLIPYLTYQVLNPTGTGRLIANFLIGEKFVEDLFLSIGLQKKRKRTAN